MKIIVWGIIWGLLLASQDLMNYFLYVLLLLYSPTVITCDNFLTYYTSCSIIYTILYGIYSIFSGLLTYYLSPIINKSFLITIIIQIWLIPFMIAPHLLSQYLSSNEWIFLAIIWQLQQLIAVQANNFYWMIIKQTTDDFPTINKIGNTGELTTNIVGAVILGVVGLIDYFTVLSLTNIFLYFLLSLIIIHLATFTLTYLHMGFSPP